MLLLTQSGLYSLILILCIYPEEALLNETYFWHINKLGLPHIFFHNFFFPSKNQTIILPKRHI